MTTSTGSGITVRDNESEALDDVSRTGSASVRMCSRDEWGSRDGGGRSAADRRRSFAAISPSRLSSSPPTIENIELDVDDDDSDDEEETNINVRLMSKHIEEILRGGDLCLEEPLPMAASNDRSLLEELDQVTTLHSFSPTEGGRSRLHRFSSAPRYSPLYRCYSTTMDPPSSSRLAVQSPRRRRISWCTFDQDKVVVHPAVERCRRQDTGPERITTEDTTRQGDCQPNHSEPVSSATCNDAQVNAAATLYLREQLRAMFQVADNRLALKLFGSHNALLKEKQRQKAVGNFVIHPCSSFRYTCTPCS